MSNYEEEQPPRKKSICEFCKVADIYWDPDYHRPFNWDTRIMHDCPEGKKQYEDKKAQMHKLVEEISNGTYNKKNITQTLDSITFQKPTMTTVTKDLEAINKELREVSIALLHTSIREASNAERNNLCKKHLNLFEQYKRIKQQKD